MNRNINELYRGVEPLAQNILNFWFGEFNDSMEVSPEYTDRWFSKNPSFDTTIKKVYGSYLETAYMGSLDRWSSTLAGLTASIIMLDQFPRHIFRADNRAWFYDKKALSLCLLAIEHKDWFNAPTAWTKFLLMPLMHAEDMSFQVLGLKKLQEVLDRTDPHLRHLIEGSVVSAKRHQDVIRKFGRFPHRNLLLKRDSTPEEQAFLKQPGSKF